MRLAAANTAFPGAWLYIDLEAGNAIEEPVLLEYLETCNTDELWGGFPYIWTVSGGRYYVQPYDWTQFNDIGFSGGVHSLVPPP